MKELIIESEVGKGSNFTECLIVDLLEVH